MIALGPERVADLDRWRDEDRHACREGMWGVYDDHARRWVSVDHASERDALDAKFELDHPRPWDLRVDRADEDGQPRRRGQVNAWVTLCEACSGTGSILRAGDRARCPHCAGKGKVRW